MLDLYEVELNAEMDKNEEEKRKAIRNLKRKLGRNRDFWNITNVIIVIHSLNGVKFALHVMLGPKPQLGSSVD